MIANVLIILIACLLNRQHKESLLLVLIVGWGVVMPIPKEFGALIWYSICASIETLILLSALSLRTPFSKPIIYLSFLFVIVHYLGWAFDGYIVGSPYHYFARTLEYTELLTCVILSHPIINFVKGKLYDT